VKSRDRGQKKICDEGKRFPLPVGTQKKQKLWRKKDLARRAHTQKTTCRKEKSTLSEFWTLVIRRTQEKGRLLRGARRLGVEKCAAKKKVLSYKFREHADSPRKKTLDVTSPSLVNLGPEAGGGEKKS